MTGIYYKKTLKNARFQELGRQVNIFFLIKHIACSSLFFNNIFLESKVNTVLITCHTFGRDVMIFPGGQELYQDATQEWNLKNSTGQGLTLWEH